MADLVQRLRALHDESLSPGQHQAVVEENFPFILAGTSFHLWRPGEPVHQAGVRFLIGVATWSRYDWLLLNALDEVLDVREEWVEVFNVSSCTQLSDFEEYVPGLGSTIDTPVVGRWEEGQVQEKAFGFSGRAHVLDWFGLSIDLSQSLRP